MTNITLFVAAFVLFTFSFFFSLSESVYSSVDKLRLERDVKENVKQSRNALLIATTYDRTIFTVLFGNNLVNIVLTALWTMLAFRLDAEANTPGLYLTLFPLILFIVILSVGEIIPKTIGLKFNYRLSYVLIYPFLIFRLIFYPVVFFVMKIADFFTNMRKQDENENDVLEELYTEDELQVIVDEIEESGLLTEETSELVRSALEFTETEAYEIMTPRVDLVMYDIEDNIYEVIKEGAIFGFSRVPVYEDTVDNIIGILPTKLLLRLLLSKQKINVRSLIVPALFVPHGKRISAILTEFKTTKTHIAVVIDEYGGMEGVLTMEDIVEEIIGEIWDESDVIDEPIIKKGEGHYIFDGNFNLEDFFEDFDIRVDLDTDYDTLGGWCLDQLDRFANVGDEFTYDNHKFKILKVDRFAVDKVEVIKIKEE